MGSAHGRVEPTREMLRRTAAFAALNIVGAYYLRIPIGDQIGRTLLKCRIANY